jgi:hypothetical protein
VRSGRVIASWQEIGIVATAFAGVLLFGCQYEYLATLSQSHDYAERLRRGAIQPTYDLRTLPWKIAGADVFDVNPAGATVVTSAEPAAYQAYATVNTDGAAAADLHFEANVDSGGLSIGLQQAGKWIATSSSVHAGVFSDSISAHLGYRRSLTVVVANNNSGGTSQFSLRFLRLYLRR